MKDLFYCGACGKWKSNSTKVVSTKTTKPHCQSCVDRYFKRLKANKPARKNMDYKNDEFVKRIEKVESEA